MGPHPRWVPSRPDPRVTGARCFVLRPGAGEQIDRVETTPAVPLSMLSPLYRWSQATRSCRRWIVLLSLLFGVPATSAAALTPMRGADVQIAVPPHNRPQAGVALAEDPADPKLFGDPRLAYGPHDLLYLAGTAYDASDSKPPAPVRLSINLLASRDGGRHWTWIGRPSGPVAPAPILDDYPSIAVDPVSGKICVAWTRIFGGSEVVLAAQSTDGGDTFSKPAILPGRIDEGASLALDQAGGSLVAFMDRSANEMDVARLAGDRMANAVEVGALRPVPPTLGGLRFRIGSEPALARDPQTGTFYLTWLVLDRTHTRLVLFSSTDDGRHWNSLPVPAADPQANVFMPNVAVSPSGVIGLMWYEQSGAAYTVRLAVSTSCGRTFAAPVTMDSAPSSLYGMGPTYLGDYGALALDHSRASIAWTDNRTSRPTIHFNSLRVPSSARC